jgi:hypothetical protein
MPKKHYEVIRVRNDQAILRRILEELSNKHSARIIGVTWVPADADHKEHGFVIVAEFDALAPIHPVP